MSLDCQLEKIKANKSNDKSMFSQIKLVYILKTTGASWINLFWNFSPWANLRTKVLAETSSSVWTASCGSALSSYPTCVFLSSPSISPSSMVFTFIIDNSWPRFSNPLSTITCGMTRQWIWIDVWCVFKWHPSYLDELQQPFKTMPGITNMVLAS